MLKYEITPLLLERIKNIHVLMAELKRYKLSSLVLYNLQREANAQSAYSSTSIEGNPLPLTDVKRILKSKPKQLQNSEKEVINYNEALLWLNSSNNIFDLKLILQIHQKVMHGLLPKSLTGKIRKEPVFVNDPKLRKTIFWPPDHQDVNSLMTELIQYTQLNITTLDPIILAALFHKQFVIIHPFLDGNGRTVRLLTKTLLAKMGFDTFHLFSFENYYNQNVSNYFLNVGVRGNYYDIYKKIDFTSWLEYFAAGVLDELYRVKKQIEIATDVSISQSPETVLNADQKKIISYIEEHGFISDKKYAKITARAKATRTGDFNKLIGLGLIQKAGRGPGTHYILKS
jgi:Fic family protein